MRHARAAMSLVLSAFVSASVGCRIAETPPPLPSNVVFKRDISNGKGCLEYSWSSEGKRQLLQLDPTLKEKAGDGPTAKDASHVQVYALTNGQYSLKDWQFPSGLPHRSPVVGAIVEVKGIEAVGTVFYQDRSIATETKALVPMQVACPTAPEKAPVVHPEITGLDPRSVTRNSAVTITVTGANFTRDSVVLIDGANPNTQYVSPSVLEAEIEANDTEIPGRRSVKVHAAKNGKTSNEVMLVIQ